MSDDRDQQIAAALEWLGNGLGVKLSPDQYVFYLENLEDLGLDVVLSAIRLLGKTSTAREYFPRPADIRALAEQSRASGDVAECAWMRFRWALQRVSVYEAITFDDPILHATILSLFGGWPQTIEISSSTKELSILHATFVKTYAALARAGAGHPEPLPGLYPGEVRAVPALAVPMPVRMITDTVAAPRELGGPVDLGQALVPWRRSTNS